MAGLDNLQDSLGTLDDDELRALIRGIRKDRRVSKRVVRTTSKKSRVEAKDKLMDLLGGMTAEEKAVLLKGLKK